mmetsp:Transcript_10038/g.27425  ORF Transcript_10038/g.27425 Transcript_10038/m.27425 type:complete len:888 (+) Transcript_10038:208-2871(+)
MAWVFQPVVNVCIEILLLILFGFLVAWGKVLKSDTFLPQVNLFVLRVSIPVFTIYQLGIRLDLTDKEAWRTLAAYVLWVSIIQVLIIAYVWTFGKKYWAEAGLQNLLLTANNTIMIGLPIMEATWGKAGRFIALLTAVIIFIQILPFSISTFENENWKAKKKAQVVQPPYPPPPDLPLDPSTAATVNVLTEEPGSRGDTKAPKGRGKGASQGEWQEQRGKQGGRRDGDKICTASDGEELILAREGKREVHWQNGGAEQAQREGAVDREVGSHGEGRQSPSLGGSVCARSEGEGGGPMHVTIVAADVSAADYRQQQQQQQRGVQACPRCGRLLPATLMSKSSSDMHLPRLLLPPSSPSSPHHLQQQQQQQRQQPWRRSHSNIDIQLSLRTGQLSNSTALSGSDAADAAAGRCAKQQHQSRHAGMDDPGETRPNRPPDLCSISMPASASVLPVTDDAHGRDAAGLQSSSVGAPHMRAAAASDAWIQAQLRPAAAPLLLPSEGGLQGSDMVCAHCGLVQGRAGQHGKVLAMSGQLEGRQAEGTEAESSKGYLDPGARGYTITSTGSSSSCSGSGSSKGSQCCSKQTQQQQLQQLQQPGIPATGSDGVSQQKGWSSKRGLSSGLKRLRSHLTASMAIRDGARGRGRGLPGLLAIIDTPLYSGSQSPHHHSQSRKQSKQHQHGKKKLQERWRTSKQHLHDVQQHIATRMETMPEGVRLAFVILKNPMLWSIFVALVVSCSGLRQFLDPDSPQFRLEVGWITELLRLIAGTTVPLSLFNNGVWLYGKQFWKGNIRKFLVVMFVKIVCLPFLQLGCAKAVGLSTPAGMSLIILSICPVATMSFVVSSQYNHGADIVTMVTVAGTMLLVPLVLGALNLPKSWGFYDYDVSQMPLD